MIESPAHRFEPIAVSPESTVVAEFVPDGHLESRYQSEAELEAGFIELLKGQAYEHLRFRSEADLVTNLRTQLEVLNGIEFSDAEWERFFTECVAGDKDGIVEKTARIQEDHVQLLRRDDGSTKNVRLIDKTNVHNNRLQVINQYEVEGARRNRYDVTVLVNGLPMVHIELKRRGVAIREAFNQINRYQRDSFWAGSGLFEYVQIFRDQQRHPHQVLLQHHASPAPGREGRREARTADLQQLRIHQLVGRCQQPAHPGCHRLRPDILRQAHPAQHPHQVLRVRRRSDAARDASVSDCGNGGDLAPRRDLDQLPQAGVHRGRRLCLAHDRVREDPHQLQGRATGQPYAGHRQGPLRGRPQGPGLPDDARVRPLPEGCGELEHFDPHTQATAGGSGRPDHHHDYPEAVQLHRWQQDPPDLRQPRRDHL